MREVISELSDPVILKEFTPGARFIVQEKLSRGLPMIDLRVWNKWNQDGQFHPSPNGLAIVKADFMASLEKLQVFLAGSDCNTQSENVSKSCNKHHLPSENVKKLT